MLITSSGVCLQEASQLKPSIIPPPASAEDFINVRLPIDVFTSAMFLYLFSHCVNILPADPSTCATLQSLLKPFNQDEGVFAASLMAFLIRV